MKWQNPPHSGKYKLVVTRKLKNDISLIVLCPQPRIYSWNNAHKLKNAELREYFLSMREEIEAGVYDNDLLAREIEENGI